jgi:twinkle protein
LTRDPAQRKAASKRMDWTDIEARLCDRAEEVCRYLFPNGKREGAEFVVGSLAGEAGNSLKINLSGKAGKWKDFAGDAGGPSLCSLWMAARSLPKFGAAVAEAKRFLGIQDDWKPPVRSVREYAPAGAAEPTDESAWKAVAETWAKCQPLTEGGPVWKYLVEQRRLDPVMLEAFGVREVLLKGWGWTMVFPYYLPADETETPIELRPAGPAWLKFEPLMRPNGKKKEWTTKAPEKSLFGLPMSEDVAFKKARHVILCEGEKDSITWASYGCAAWEMLPVSVPFGAKWKGQDKNRPSPNREWLDRCWDWLQGFETVFICTDDDEAGRRAAADIITEIGPRRCRLVRLPRKDPNKCREDGISTEEMKAALDAAQDFAPEKVVAAAAYEKEFLSEWFDQELEPGLELPWDFGFKIRPAELTIWTGIEKSGKTTALGFVLIGLMHQGERALVASFEIKVAKTLKKLSRQVYGGLLYAKKMVDKCAADSEAALENYRQQARADAVRTFRWMAPKLWVYDHVGIGHWQQLIDDIRWARRRHGITQFVVDNFMRLGITKDDYPQQAEAITAFASLAMELNIHIHMVVHQNKSEGHKNAGGKRTVSGAYEIIANAHNIVEVQRDEKKGEQVSELWEKKKIGTIGDQEFAQEKNALDLKPDGKIILHAQRDGETQNGSKYLWFLWESQQYADKPPGHREHAPIKFIEQPELSTGERGGNGVEAEERAPTVIDADTIAELEEGWENANVQRPASNAQHPTEEKQNDLPGDQSGDGRGQ